MDRTLSIRWLIQKLIVPWDRRYSDWPKFPNGCTWGKYSSSHRQWVVFLSQTTFSGSKNLYSPLLKRPRQNCCYRCGVSKDPRNYVLKTISSINSSINQLSFLASIRNSLRSTPDTILTDTHAFGDPKTGGVLLSSSCSHWPKDFDNGARFHLVILICNTG